jgi:cytoskeletal protein CcmA (bactofilin family)
MIEREREGMSGTTRDAAEEIESGIDTVLADDIDFSGALVFDKSLMIKGRFRGEIRATGLLVVGRRAEVTATIEAREIRNFGTIVGNVSAGERIELCETAVLTGDIRTPLLVVREGGRLNGRAEMPAPPSDDR